MKVIALVVTCDRMGIFVTYFFVCFTNTVEELAPESVMILSEQNLALTSLMLICPYNTGL